MSKNYALLYEKINNLIELNLEQNKIYEKMLKAYRLEELYPNCTPPFSISAQKSFLRDDIVIHDSVKVVDTITRKKAIKLKIIKGDYYVYSN